MGDAKGVFDHASPSRLLAGSVWFSALMFASGLAWWILTISVCRVFGPEGCGVLSTASSLRWFILMLLFEGAFQGLMKYGSESLAKRGPNGGPKGGPKCGPNGGPKVKEKVGFAGGRRKALVYFASSLKYLSILGFLVCAVMLSAVILANIAPLPGFGLDAQMQIIFVSVALATLASGLRAAILAAIGSVQRTDYLSIVATIDSFFALLFGSAIMILGFDAAAVPFVLVFGAIGQLLVGAYLLKKSFPAGLGGLAKVKKSFGAFLETYRYGIYVSLSLIAIYLIKNLDIIVLKMFLPYEKVGIYGVAESYSNIFFYITSVSSPLIPAIAEAYKRGKRKLLRTYVKLTVKWSLMVGLACGILIFMLAEPLVVDVYGADFAEAVLPVRLLLPGTFVILFCYNLSTVLVGLGKARLGGLLLVIAALIYAAFLFVLIPMYGIVGAAAASLLMNFSTNLLIPYYVKKFTKAELPKGSWKLALSAFAMAVFLFIVPKGLGLAATVAETAGGLSLFALLLYVTGYVSDGETKMFRTVLSSFKV